MRDLVEVTFDRGRRAADKLGSGGVRDPLGHVREIPWTGVSKTPGADVGDLLLADGLFAVCFPVLAVALFEHVLEVEPRVVGVWLWGWVGHRSIVRSTWCSFNPACGRAPPGGGR